MDEGKRTYTRLVFEVNQELDERAREVAKALLDEQGRGMTADARVRLNDAHRFGPPSFLLASLEDAVVRLTQARLVRCFSGPLVEGLMAVERLRGKREGLAALAEARGGKE